MTTFHVPENDAISTVAAGRAAGGPDLVLADGSAFGTVFPKVVTVTRGTLGEDTLVCRLEVTGRTGATLTIAGAAEGTADADLLPGDHVFLAPTKLAMTEVHGAIAALEATAAGLGTAATHPATDFLTPSGDGSALTGLTESQVTGLTADLAARQPIAPLPDASAATPALYLGSDHSDTPCFKDEAGLVYLLPYVAAPSVPEAIPGLLAWWDASRNRYQDTPPTVPAAYGDRVRSIVSRDASAQVASTADAGHSLLAVGGGFDGGSGPGLYGDASVDFNAPALSAATALTRPYTLAVVGTEGASAEVFRFHYAGKDANSSPYNYITCETDSSGQVVIFNAPVMDQTVRMSSLHRHVWVVRCDNSGSSVWVDGVDRTTSHTPTFDWGALNFGGRSGTESHVLGYDRVLTDAEVAGLSAYLGRATLNLIADGNSLTIGTDSAAGAVPTEAWPYLLANAWAATDPAIRAANVAVSGQTTGQRDAAAAATADTHFDPAASRNVLVMWELTNDLFFGATAAQAYAHYATYAANRKAANPGVKVVLMDMIDRAGVPSGAVNALVGADFTVATADPYTRLPGPGVTYADMLIRLGSIPALSDHTNATYFGSDGTHLTPAGYALVADQVRTSLALLAGGPVAPAPAGPAVPQSQVAGLAAALAAKQPAGSYLSGASNSLPLDFSFGGSNANATGNDLCPRHYASYAGTVARLILSTDANVTGTFTVRVMRSSDGGATFPDTIGTVSLASGSRSTTTTTIATPALAAGDWLRCDIAAVSGTVGSWMLRISTLSRNQ